MATPPSPIRPHATRFLVGAIFIDAIGFGLVLPVLPGLVMELAHVPLDRATAIGGWLGAVYAAMAFLLGPAMGNLGDRFGRRPVLLAAIGGIGLDYLLMAVAPTLVWLFVGRAIAGALGASYGPAFAAVADMSTPAERAKRFGQLSAAFGIGFVAGPALGGLIGALDPRAPFWVAAALALANAAYGLAVFPETLPVERRRRFDWRRANPVGALRSLGRLPGLAPLAVVYFLWYFAVAVYPATWSYFALARYGWSTAMIGASLAWTGMLMALIQAMLVGRVVARVGERRAAMVGITAGAFGFLAFAFAPYGWMVFPIMLPVAFQSLANPSLNALMSRRAPADSQGELQGFNGSVSALASIAAPLVLNPALAHFTGSDAPVRFAGAAFLIACGAALAALAVLALAGRRASAAAA